MHHKYNLHIKDRMQLPNQRKTWPSGNDNALHTGHNAFMNPMFQFLIVHLRMFVYWRDSTVPSMNKPAQLSMKTNREYLCPYNESQWGPPLVDFHCT